ncbi:MAG: YncE family protein [Rhizobacter sp.]|nr:YncE family protein [Burkholderiales bacterium]
MLICPRFAVLATSLIVALSALPTTSAHGQIAVIALENKVVLVNGVATTVANPKPDGAALLDLSTTPPRLIAQIELPSATVLGPPTTVALTPDESMALVGSGQRADVTDKTKLVDNNFVTLIDLKSSPAKVLGTVITGAQPTGIAINPAGTLALVANRGDGTVAVLKISGKQVSKIASLSLGKADSSPSGIVFTPDGKTALVTRDGDSVISVLTIEGDTVAVDKREISAGMRPYGITMSPHGRWAAVANIGRGAGDIDTFSIIDLNRSPPRNIDTMPVGQTPEGIMASPDGEHLAVVVMNGSNKATSHPYFNDNGFLQIWRIDRGFRPIKVAEAPIGHWSQGALFSNDGRQIVVMNMVENELQVFAFDGAKLTETTRIKVNGGPAAGRVAGVR